MIFFALMTLVVLMSFKPAPGDDSPVRSSGRNIIRDSKSCEKFYFLSCNDTIPKQILKETYNDSAVTASHDSVKKVTRNVIENRQVHSKSLKPKIL